MSEPALPVLVEPLLVEIGCEEIPARFLADAEKQFGERLLAALQAAYLVAPEAGGVGEPPLKTYSTPRRIVGRVLTLLARQPDRVEEVTGPPAKVAFDGDGKPTRAAQGFAAKNGVRVEELLQVETPKGLHIAARRTTPGRPATEVLAELLPQVIKSMAFPKSMTWESSGLRFVRPVRWILALLGEGEGASTVDFEIAGVRSAPGTFGHRSAGSDLVQVEGFADYAQKLRLHFVEFDPESRRQAVRSEVNVVLEPWMDAVPDATLEEWIVNSTEWLAGVRGGFDERFLALPREILVTVMRDHQKYFAVEDREGKLQPYFVTLLNRDRDASGVIRAGHERVLSARFADAEFFWNADQKVPLRDRLPMLDRVTYQAKLGSYGDKVRRIKAIAEFICAALDGQGSYVLRPQGGEWEPVNLLHLTSEQGSRVLRAVDLCKCDLTTQMVQEFTELQGVVGGLYAHTQGEPEEVWQAIYDHYKPVNVDDDCPRSTIGAIVSLADKLDAVVAGFSVGLEPTGSSDPFGLRRAGNGIVKIAVEAMPGIDLLDFAGRVVGMELGLPRTGDPVGQVAKFLRERTEYFLHAVQGIRHDTVRAVVRSLRGWSPPKEALQRGSALEQVRDTDDFRALATAAKRTQNILSKSARQEDFGYQTEVNEGLLLTREERDLYKAYRQTQESLRGFEAASDYGGAILALAKLRPVVDRFFDEVMVMDEDRTLRANRLRLLAELSALAFTRFADLSEIESVPAGNAEPKSV